ncbi:MAG TPA: hypothetical protein ENK43_06900 [Planctomycetes bacterium]|nr:hypothetical protein [Planctomycetota bacterium]
MTAPRTRNRVPFSFAVAAVVAGVLARVVEAGKSVWLDELHTMQLARQAGVGDLIELIRHDVHAPLFYIALMPWGSGSVESLRWIPLVTGLLAIPFLVDLLRQWGFGRAALMALAATLLLAPFQIRYGVELRPYAWLQVFAVIALWAGLGKRGSERIRMAVFAGAVACGLYVHYLMAVPVVALGAARLLSRPRGVLSLQRLMLAGGTGVLLFLPWIFTSESWLLHDPSRFFRNEHATPGASVESAPATPSVLPQLLQGAPRVLTPSLRGLGGLGFGLVAAGWAVMLLFLVRAGRDLLRGRRLPGERGLLAILSTGFLGFVLTAVASVEVWKRLPVQYFATVAWVWAVLVAVLIEGSPKARRRTTMLLLLGALGLMAAGQVAGRPREDLRGAVNLAREWGAGDDVHYTALMRQPGHYDPIEVWKLLAPKVRAVPPADIPPDDGRGVVLVTRKVDPRRFGVSKAVLRRITAGRTLARFVWLDDAVGVFLYLPGGDDTR